ncbi:MAG: PhoPQ-activated protein PqaA family protein, partial [Limisphaerales bacterium]
LAEGLAQQPLDEQWTLFISSNNVTDLLLEGDSVWATTFDGGLVRWDARTGAYVKLTPGHGLYHELYAIALGPDGALWIRGSGGLQRLASDGQWQKVWRPWTEVGERRREATGRPAEVISNIVTGPRGTLWFSWNYGVARLEFTSQSWRDHVWKHELILVRPKQVRNPDIAFLLIGGSEPAESHLQQLRVMAEQSGAITAVISEVPNQPLYGGRVEDALIAYTLDQYLRSEDETWPLLFPMVKSAVRACDVVTEFAKAEFGLQINRFVLSGASKRGWTTWLTAAMDDRVAGIAPMVFDMLNMKAQTEWARRVYGDQSERIHDYTEAGLVGRINEPTAVQLLKWIDPFAYRNRFTMPKLILIGTNDPYWTVDSMRHYWNELPEPKLVFQTPNAGHGLGDGSEALKTLSAFFTMIADRAPLPQLNWTVNGNQTNAEIEIRANQPFKAARLWMAISPDRDFRNDRWEAHPVKRARSPGTAGVSIVVPNAGYRAFLMEAEFLSPAGKPFKLSTEATVVPDLRPRSAPERGIPPTP